MPIKRSLLWLVALVFQASKWRFKICKIASRGAWGLARYQLVAGRRLKANMLSTSEVRLLVTLDSRCLCDQHQKKKSATKIQLPRGKQGTHVEALLPLGEEWVLKEGASGSQYRCSTLPLVLHFPCQPATYFSYTADKSLLLGAMA
ncbi:hypothetical protein I79_002642 [Cricetulus griseus]|uniref:Uncharacterized protein n=1 Tax=Cricetulus griseus TaxID=10029 RepID=G3GXZ5_CRIGR|nr:hypothetical protein I79_002642 [Cricetulus griseus]